MFGVKMGFQCIPKIRQKIQHLNLCLVGLLKTEVQANSLHNVNNCILPCMHNVLNASLYFVYTIIQQNCLSKKENFVFSLQDGWSIPI